MPIDAGRAGRRLVAASALLLAATTTAGCAGTEGPEPGTEIPAQERTTGAPPTVGRSAEAGDGPAYDGPYDEDFRADLSSYAGQQVTLTGEVGDVVSSRSAYVITAPGAPETAPLLVSARYAAPEVQRGAVVEVTGTVREAFEPPVVEEAVGDGGESGFYAEHAGEPYLDGATVDPAE